MHPIDPSSGRLMQSVGIESSGFRSRRLTRQMADEADLILCFEKQQRKEIVTLAQPPYDTRSCLTISRICAITALATI